MKPIKRLLLILFASCFVVENICAAQKLDGMGVAITSSDASTYSYSDKEAGFYYGNAIANDWTDWYAGWNIRAKRIFADYRLFADGKLLDRTHAKATVFPHKLVRNYGDVVEEFYLVDSRKVLFVSLDDGANDGIGIELVGQNVKDARADGNSVIYTPVELPNEVVRVATKSSDSRIFFDGKRISSDARCGGFVITFGSRDESLRLVEDFCHEGNKWLHERVERMQSLLDDNSLETGTEVDKALAWIDLTTDELVTKQHGGWGIYAGFPWFTDFWGRDMFISMPGAVLCTGQFEVARSILESFAKYQNMDVKSPDYGRVPNRLNLDGILYNTTDGTPRFVAEIYDYWKYTGDLAFVKRLYKNVKIATDASLDNFTDERGYLTHADADTWMDAKRQGKYPCSPRGNRAVDIQALWYNQLACAARIAESIGKKEDARRWREAAEKLKANFAKDFVDKNTGRIYDHLNADGTPDLQLRPNTMYAYNLVADSIAMQDTRTLWSKLVYPWGVSSLDQEDNQFHPYHEQWHRYHKDDAYHNGTVWLWLNGQAMQSMIRFGQVAEAYKLFDNMCRQALSKGAIGGLSECADAWALPGRTEPRLSGTFLQAWSNAEQIRVWNQYFLGVRPDLTNDVVVLNPVVSSIFNRVDASVKLGDGSLSIKLVCNGDSKHYSYEWSGSKEIIAEVDLECFPTFRVPVKKGEKIEIDLSGDRLSARVLRDGNVAIDCKSEGRDAAKVKYFRRCNEYFRGIGFAKPSYRENLKSMSRYFDPPLDYYSIE